MPKRSKLDRFYDLHANFLLATFVSRVATCKLTGWEDVRSSDFRVHLAPRLPLSLSCEQGSPTPYRTVDIFKTGYLHSSFFKRL